MSEDDIPRSSADSSVIDEGFYCKISLDCNNSYDQSYVPKFGSSLGSKEPCGQKEHWFRLRIWGLLDALTAGMIYAAAVAATFGFILPSVEVLFNEILGQRPVNNFFDASGCSQAAWLVSGGISGFVLGFTHSVVSESVATYLEQFTGFHTFVDIRSSCNNAGQRVQNLALDVLSEDAIIVVSFGASLAVTAVAFLGTGVSPVLVQLTSCIVGGIFVGAVLLVIQKWRKGSFSVERRERLDPAECLTFFTIFEEKIGNVIRQKDYTLWVNVFLSRVFAGVAFRPIAILTSAAVQSKLQGEKFSEHSVVALCSFTSAVTLLSGWYASIRLGGWLANDPSSMKPSASGPV